jgi:hypothetical protein
MPEMLSVSFAALIPVAFFKLFFDDLRDLRANVKSFCRWFTFEMIFELSPETSATGLRFLFRLALGALGGFLLYHRLSS